MNKFIVLMNKFIEWLNRLNDINNMYL